MGSPNDFAWRRELSTEESEVARSDGKVRERILDSCFGSSDKTKGVGETCGLSFLRQSYQLQSLLIYFAMNLVWEVKLGILRGIWKDMLIILVWAAGFAAVALKTFYENPLAFRYWGQNPIFSGLDVINLVLIFIVSVVAGTFLVKAETILIGLAGSLALAILLLIAWFTWPVITGEIYSPSALVMEMFYFRAISVTFRLLFPGIIVFGFLGCLFGGFVGEKLRMRLASFP